MGSRWGCLHDMIELMQVVRFKSFHDAQKAWQSLETLESYPFQQWWYQSLYSKHFCSEVDLVYLLGVYDGDDLVAVGGFERIGDKVVLLGMKPVLGGEDVTDYGEILQLPITNYPLLIWELIVKYFRDLGVSNLQLDYVREDSVVYSVFADSNSEHVRLEKQEVAPYINLGASWDDYLAELPRVKRKELRRKIRRLEETNSFHFCKESTFKQDFDDFIRLHRLSSFDKDQFMSDEMKAFFWDLVTHDSYPYQHRFCFLEMEGKRVAATLSFITDDRVLLYNSGFDPDYNYYSVGLILKAYVLKNAIEEKRTVYDFLRGDERYKYDMGGRDMSLWKISISL